MSLRRICEFSLAALTLAGSLTAQEAPEPLQPGDIIAIYGDSITEGKKYSVMMESYFLMCQPQKDLQALQFGWSGEKSWGVLPRMEVENLPFKHTVATTCYGMNDGGYKPIDPAVQKQYRDATTGIVKKLKSAGVRTIVVGSPGVVDSFTYKKPGVPAEVYNATLADLGRIGKEVAAEQGVLHADVHGTMMEAMVKAKAKHGPEFPVAGGDGVHPAANGHLVMAYAFLKALGCPGEIGTITWDVKAGKAEATEGHMVKSAQGMSLTVESTKYPFCFTGDPASPDSTRGMVEFLPFNEDLNRYILVVRNAPKEGLNLTWGTASKDFTFEQLKNGINLAAEFLENPFSAPFNQVMSTITAQQVYETAAVKILLHSLPDWNKYFPGEQDDMTAKVVAKDEELRKKSREAIKPVTHTLVLAPIGAAKAVDAATPAEVK